MTTAQRSSSRTHAAAARVFGALPTVAASPDGRHSVRPAPHPVRPVPYPARPGPQSTSSTRPARHRRTGAAAAPPTASQSRALGQRAREAVPLESHAELTLGPGRSDPVQTLERQARTRVFELVPVRHARMLSSPLEFSRGAAAIMAEDLARTPDTGLTVQCNGDAHLFNFGVFESPDSRLTFDLAHFDETLPGPWEWDLKRLATSVLIAARAAGIGRKGRERTVLATVAAYRTAMAGFAQAGTLAVWHARAAVEPLLEDHHGASFPRPSLKHSDKALRRARTRSSAVALATLTERRGGRRAFVDCWPLLVPIDRLLTGAERERAAAHLEGLLDAHRQALAVEPRALLDRFGLVDLARIVIGVAAVGAENWVALLTDAEDQPLLLEIRQARASVLEPFVDAATTADHGQRIVAGERLTRADRDPLLGSASIETSAGVVKDYRLGELRHWRATADIKRLDRATLGAYGRLCGWTLARAHARTGDRIAIATYLGDDHRFDRAVLEFARAYAKQNRRDHEALAAAAESGRIVIEPGI